MIANPRPESIKLPKLTMRELKKREREGMEELLRQGIRNLRVDLDADFFVAVLRLAIKHLEAEKKPTKKKGKK